MEASGVITINGTAAGHDWYTVVPAAPGDRSSDRVDLLTVLEHELGHVLGLPDNARRGDIMNTTLGTGVRREPTTADVALVAADQHSGEVLDTAARSVYDNRGVTQPSAGDELGRRWSHAPGSLTSATVDAALASLVGTVSGHGNGPADATPEEGPLASNARLAGGVPVDVRASGATGSVALPFSRRPLSSLFSVKNRRAVRSTTVETAGSS
jgi:hypothetical protein